MAETVEARLLVHDGVAFKPTATANPLPSQLVAGAALIGTVAIDQTTPGTTNAVAIIPGQAGITAGAGTVSALTPRATLASDDPAVTSLQIIDDWDETDRAKVNIIPGQAGITAGAGTVSALTPRATLASDDPAVVSLQILDDWDETDRAKVNIIPGQAGITAGAGTVSALTPRTTLASDDPAVVALQVIDDWDETDRAKVNIIAGQAGITAGAGTVSALTPRTTLASDDPAVVALQVIDDWDETDRAKVNPIAGQAGVQGASGTATALTQRVVLATDVGLPAGESFLGTVGGTTTMVAAAELTRPADTTAYAANDAVSDSTSSPTIWATFTNIARINVGTGYIVKAKLLTDQAANVAQLRLHLFNAAPTAINDNAAQTMLYANKATWLGAIDFPALTQDGTGSTAAKATVSSGSSSLPLAFVCAAASRTLSGLLEVLGAFTPTSGQKFYIELAAENN